MSVQKIVGDERTNHFKVLDKWISYVPKIRKSFCKWNDEFDPFHFNETATVGLLANAATRAGFLSLTEFATRKKDGKRGNGRKHGRCDLWIGADVDAGIDYAIEFKQMFAQKGIGPKRFQSRFAQAELDAKAVVSDEGRHRMACLIICPRADIKHFDDMPSRVDDLCREYAEYAFRLNHKSLGPVWLAFREV